MKVRYDTKSAEGLTVYVDPAAGHLYLKVVTGETDSVHLYVIDKDGKTVTDKEIPTNQLTAVSLTNISQGFYMAKVQFNKTEMTERFRF